MSQAPDLSGSLHGHGPTGDPAATPTQNSDAARDRDVALPGTQGQVGVQSSGGVRASSQVVGFVPRPVNEPSCDRCKVDGIVVSERREGRSDVGTGSRLLQAGGRQEEVGLGSRRAVGGNPYTVQGRYPTGGMPVGQGTSARGVGWYATPHYPVYFPQGAVPAYVDSRYDLTNPYNAYRFAYPRPYMAPMGAVPSVVPHGTYQYHSAGYAYPYATSVVASPTPRMPPAYQAPAVSADDRAAADAGASGWISPAPVPEEQDTRTPTLRTPYPDGGGPVVRGPSPVTPRQDSRFGSQARSSAVRARGPESSSESQLADRRGRGAEAGTSSSAVAGENASAVAVDECFAGNVENASVGDADICGGSSATSG
ncbi:hypothetical protein C8Q76DRAFT_695599 [Earliella scabrosa]|nr:hypothetical protein C8Q76DRAFT_695599 [Earliella scabrosa]